MRDSLERWQLVFLGRLNHRDELARKLGIDLAELPRLPDCQLAMQAWIKWGADCREHLYGGFSMVVCDLKENRLTALRGYERSQHIFYYLDKDRIILSTSTKAIFADPAIPRELDELKIADTLVLNHEDTSRSYFKGVSVVGQANTLTIAGEGDPVVETHDCFASVTPIRYANEDDYVEQARVLVDQSLESAFRSPDPPAISLSAGLDSTTLAVAMIERMRREGTARPGALKAYTGVPEKSWDGRVRANWLGDESGPVKALAAMYPELDVQFESGEHFSYDQGIDMIQSYADMPVRGVGNSAWGSAILQACRRDRHPVLVSGVDGNGTISFAAAYILFAKWAGSGNWLKLASEVRMFVAKRPGTRITSVLAQAVLTNLPDGAFNWYMKRRGHDRTTGFRSFSAIRPDYARDIDVTGRMRQADWDDRYRRRPSREEMMRMMMQRGVRNDGGGLMEANKVMTGVEGISPFGDRKLMEFCFAIPDDQFYKNGVDRRLIRRMMEGKLPQEVLTARRGEQAADWHSRRKRELDRISAEIERLEDVPSVAQRLDLDRMKAVIENWPEETPISTSDYPDYGLARFGVGRALAVARFINQVEGRN